MCILSFSILVLSLLSYYSLFDFSILLFVHLYARLVEIAQSRLSDPNTLVEQCSRIHVMFVDKSTKLMELYVYILR